MLDAYLSNELLVETSLEVVEHLAVCDECSRRLADRAELRDRLRKAVMAAPVPRIHLRTRWSLWSSRIMRALFR